MEDITYVVHLNITVNHKERITPTELAEKLSTITGLVLTDGSIIECCYVYHEEV